MGLLMADCRFMLSFSLVDPVRVLQEVQRQTGWVHCHLERTLTGSYKTAVGAILNELNLVPAEPVDGDKAKLLRHIQTLSERYYQAAIESVQEHVEQARKAGKQKELIQRWRGQMLACASGGAADGADSLLEAPP